MPVELSREAIDFLASATGLSTQLPTAATEHLREELLAVWTGAAPGPLPHREHASLSHTWMQGALESALRAVREILTA